MQERQRDGKIRAIDLFAGAGGLSEGLAEALEQIDRDPGEDLVLKAINHDKTAIKSHRKNHPWAEHYNMGVEQLNPRQVFDKERVDLLTAGPECTHHSTARGGRPKDTQKRATPWTILKWIQELYIDELIIENVPELRGWGPLGADGEVLESKKGETFDAFIDSIRSLGYYVDHRVLNCADYGDPTSRKRLFIRASRKQKPRYPDPTHHSEGDGNLKKHRSAREIIDWSDKGKSIWGRDKPLKNTTNQRIADGLRKHCRGLDGIANILESLSRKDVRQLQKDIVPIEKLDTEVTREKGEPFLVKYYGRRDAHQDIDSSIDTVSTENRFAVCTPFLLKQQSGGSPPSSNDPLPTVQSKAAIAKIETEAFLIEYYGNSSPNDMDDPLPSVTKKDRFAVMMPEKKHLGVDIRYRMLKVDELARGMGFPESYSFVGTKTEQKKQLGNAVPVNTARKLCLSALKQCRNIAEEKTDRSRRDSVGVAGD